MQNKLAAIFLFILITISLTLSGQKEVNSPFARYNLGILEPQQGSFRSMGMGGTGVALRDNMSLSFCNPASYSSLDTNSFIFDFGINYGINILSDGTSKYSSDDMNFDHLMMGFPITKNWGVATGLVPYTNGYYKISKEVLKGDPDYDPITGEYTAFHVGDGNLTRFFLGSGINLTKKISAGINMNLLFGSVKRVNEFDFTDYYNVYHDNMTQRLQLTGINFDYGLQYSTSLKKNFFFNAGASLSSGQNYKSKFENLSYSFNAYGSIDTLSYSNNDSTTSYLPGSLRFGISFGKKNKFTAGIDYVITNWSKAKFPGSADHAGDTRSLLLGAEYIPDKYSNYNYFKRIEYRIGGHIEDNYLVFEGRQVKEYGFSLGFGIPMKRLSKTNIFIDFTRKSLNSDTFSHFENYFTFGASLNLFDFWFLKQKYD
jgi:hypothetical protein